jgi:putative transposase
MLRRTFNEPGHAHELTFSCFRRYRFLSRDRTRNWLADSINAARAEHQFDLWAWVFMPEHVHLIIRPRLQNYEMAVIRRAIKQPVARRALRHLRRRNSSEWLARLRVQKGGQATYRFWLKGPGYDRNIIEPRTLLQMIDYVHMNPVRRGLVERAIDWKWSSARELSSSATDAPLQVDRIPPEWLC